MATRKQQEYAQWILAEVGQINPYNRTGENLKSEYYLYQAGFLAAYLGSLLAEDVILRRQFERHCEQQRGPAARSRNIAKKP